MMTGSSRLRNWREAAAMTQSAASTKLGVSQSMLSDLEAGKKSPSLEMALLLERKTGGAVPAESWAKKRSNRRRAA